ncbi:MAG: LytR/AlgR family response regulator transcription factor [Lachnospiraceae bacterium]
MRVIACDDEEKVLKQLKEWTDDYFSRKNIEFSFQKYSTEKSLRRELDEYNGEIPLIIFMDMQQQWENSLKKIREIEQWTKNVVVIFIFGDGYNAYIEEIFDINPIYLLVKPIKRESFEKAIDFALTKMGNNKEESYIVIRRRGEKKKIYYHEIYYIERNLRKTEICCVMENYECYEKLSSLEERLGENFVRCHNSFIVNLACVKSVKRNELILNNGKCIPVSNSKSKLTREAAIRYLEGVMEKYN